MSKIALFIITVCLLAGCRSSQNNSPATATAANWTLTGFVKVDSINPILQPDSLPQFNCPLAGHNTRWAQRNVLNPAAVVKDGKVYLFFRAQDMDGTSRIGMASSSDGLHFTKHATPVLFPAKDSMQRYEWNAGRAAVLATNSDPNARFFDGVEDPRIVETGDGSYIMTYTAYDGKTARLCLATSKDLLNWTKQGLVFRSEKYKDKWSKSGAIVAKQQGSSMVATRIQGKYWMYFGDTDIFIATSTDLLNWEVAENEESKERISALYPRAGYFDSRLVEPGPYALLRDSGILLIYNGSNAANYNDSLLPKFTYAAGQALFDAQQPYRLRQRTDSYFIHPDKEYEKKGEINEVCFVEGLVPFNDRWFLYYGTADSRIAVAVK